MRIKMRFCSVVVLMILSVLFLHTSILSAGTGIKLYGYFSVNYEDVGELPDGENSPGEFSMPHFNLMGQSRISDDFRIYFNLAGDHGETVEVRNYWGEYSVCSYFNIRAGKIYRPFGLFNEKLDAVPTYLGIEPPELFDGDHLMLPRTGLLMFHGKVPAGDNTIEWALMTGNNEVVDKSKPISWDLNYNIGYSLKIGTSGYMAKEKGSPIDVGEGSPPGGILPWMVEDDYSVLGGYLQLKWNNFTFKTAYWTADHDAVRDPQKVVSLYEAGLNQNQMKRFGLDQYNTNTPDDFSMIDTDGSYNVSTFYARLGYTIKGGTIAPIKWDMTPFIFWDVYENEETIAAKEFGGDNEAGLASDGKFTKPTIGIVFSPMYNVAFKIDASRHMYKWIDPDDPTGSEDDVHYDEIRFDISYFFN